LIAFTALTLGGLTAMADEAPEVFPMNLSVGLETHQGDIVGADMAFYGDPSAKIELQETQVPGNAIGLAKEWSGRYVAKVDKLNFNQRVTFQLTFTLTKMLGTDGKVSYFLSILQGHRPLVGLRAQSLEALKSIGVSQLAGDLIQQADGTARPLITLN